MFYKTCEFVRGVTRIEDLPPEDVPEIAFIGRSNVGKSSLINALLGQKVARTSNTPGRTKQLNYFKIDKKFYVVDMPGYGFAKASRQDREEWLYLANNYFMSRKNLERVFILVDARHGLKDVDVDLMNGLDELALPYQIILTKIDKVAVKDLETVKAEVIREFDNFSAICRDLILTSANKKTGIKELYAEVKKILKIR